MGTVRTKKRKAEQAAQAKRDKILQRCGATTHAGKPCSYPAGHGTRHPGKGVCSRHTGSTRNQIAKHAKAELNGMAVPRRVSPVEALEAVLNLAAGQLVYATEKVSAMTDDELFVKGFSSEGNYIGMIPDHWLKLQREAMGDVAKYAKMGADAGIAERGQVLQEAQTAMMAQVIEAVVGDLGLNAEQKAALGPAIRQRMTLIQGGGQVVEGQAREVA